MTFGFDKCKDIPSLADHCQLAEAFNYTTAELLIMHILHQTHARIRQSAELAEPDAEIQLIFLGVEIRDRVSILRS
jgi:cystathionine beta-lyase/cystathionine gamma-synthase